jgi:hypothetical protein
MPAHTRLFIQSRMMFSAIPGSSSVFPALGLRVHSLPVCNGQCLRVQSRRLRKGRHLWGPKSRLSAFKQGTNPRSHVSLVSGFERFLEKTRKLAVRL